MKNKLKYLAALALSVGFGVAQAAGGIDISADTAQAKTDINAAGVLIIGVVVVTAAFTWIRRVIR